MHIGDSCPDFDLPGTDDKNHALSDMKRELLLVIVSCNHCPYVVAYEVRMANLAREYAQKGVDTIAVNANDASRYPDDGMAQMKARAREREFDFPYVRDDSQNLARALGARFTPEVFLFDRERKLRYQGRIDDNHRDARNVKAHDLRNALDALLTGKNPPIEETSAVGCSVKWK
ncbi:MAG: thioredoxin family protein [Polyangiaceae bacterium]